MFVNILGSIMKFCYDIFHNYGIAIIVFTFISKIVLLPITIYVQKNSIKMVKMQPAINRIKIDYFGDKDKIAEEESALYKKEKYNAFTSLIPLVIQLVILIGLVEVINHPLTHIVGINKEEKHQVINIALKNNKELNEESSSLELNVLKDIKDDKYIEEYKEVLGVEKIKEVKDLNVKFLGLDLTWIANKEKGLKYLIPIVAALSAFVMCMAQNRMNVLQSAQSKYNKYSMLVLSVGLSLYLGMFVAAGVALYWVVSNLVAILQQWILNLCIKPRKYVDYEELEKTTKELKEITNLNKNKKRTIEQIKKEKADYKRFNKVLNKHLVFYSESNGFYKYFKPTIEYILNNTNITIHYITSDYNDNIFKLEKENPQIKAYYIEEKKLITLMMKMDADVVVMTMPDLNTYHIKRSYVRKDIHYIYIPHDQCSHSLTLRPHATDHYDTIFVTGKQQKEEHLIYNKLNKLNNRVVYEVGYPLLDDMLKEYKEVKNKKEKTIVIAPSWQKDNIVDLCLDEILDNIKDEDYKIVVRPHPQHVRHKKEWFEKLKKRYEKNKNIYIQTDFTKTDTVFNADLIITDWSGIGFEYAFTTKKPVLYINTPMKIMNPNYKEVGITPINIWARDVIGKSLNTDELDKVKDTIKELLNSKDKYKKEITKVVNDYVYNIGKSGEVGAKYIIKVIQDKVKERSNNK